MPLTNEELTKRLSGQEWTAHNIRLTGELTTWPGHYDFFIDGRLKAIERMFRLVFGEDLNGLRIADLGSLEGGFALAFALRGAQVVGVEARKTNFEKLAVLRDHFELPKLNFVQADVKDFSAERFGQFDATLALGILYHLDAPAAWLRQVSAATKRVIVVDTHFAPADEAALQRIDPRIAALGPIEAMKTGGIPYHGRWFTEYGANEAAEGMVWASYSNWRSFWLTKESLLRAIRDAGFDLVLEQHDYSVGSHDRMSVEFPRTMIVGIKLSC
jgi:hypothetical protein